MPAALLEASSIRKSFAGVQALKGVSFELRPGEVHALVGENGAGKSTLIKIIAGALQADSGTLAIDGRVVSGLTPRAAREMGISAIYQQPSLFPDLTVAENVALNLEHGGPWRRVSWAQRRRAALDLFSRAGGQLDPEMLAADLTMPQQQIVEIAKAIGASAKIVIMDEPTASLAEPEVESLFSVIGGLRRQGVGIIYISHRLDEILAIADRITVLRDGETVATRGATDVNRSELIALMVGRPLDSVFPKRQVTLGETVFELRNVTCHEAGVHDVSFSVRRGEIFGIAGLAGSGRTQLAETVFGLTPADAGEIVLNGRSIRTTSAAQAIEHGLAYVPEDRRQHGVVLEMPIPVNTSLASLTAVSRLGMIQEQREAQLAQRYISELHIKAAMPGTVAGELSGGNQQKVALARWMATDPTVLILDEPTQGIDVGSKAEIHALMGDLAQRGMAVIVISSELPELLGVCDRIAVMRQGHVRGILNRDMASQQNILALAMGHELQ